MAERELPHKATRRSGWHEEASRLPSVQEAVEAFLGFGRTVPPEILEDELIELIWSKILELGSGEAAGLWIRSQTPMAVRVQVRAVLMNLSRMKREGVPLG